ncbi:uncharacterized protein B0T15DRAFT_507656 [Chaetomium strumarium]|uniref:Uncharacterized protein n=1 Tax=Chaetomium strumarium TaxID=1170767 RepID=A0AAJ0M6V5_9PEZI|nr:hypothetical protein B0T15DRAFT_507656 [Chaetomium strumarium]
MKPESISTSTVTAPTPSKRRRVADVIVISSDAEPDGCKVLEPRRGVAAAANDRDSEAASRRRRPLGLFAQLQEDGFRDLKRDICIELNSLHQPLEGRDGDTEKALRDALRQWVEQRKPLRDTNHLYYRLDNRYSRAYDPATNSYKPPAFVGRDRAVVDMLGELTGDVPLEIFIAVLEREDTIDSVRSFLARSLIDLQGRELASDIPVDDQNWAVLLVPRDSVVDFLMECADALAASSNCYPLKVPGIQGLVEYFSAQMAVAGNSDRMLPIFKEFCATLWQLGGAKGLSFLPRDVTEKLLKAVVHTQDWPFLGLAAGRLGPSPPFAFFIWVVQEVRSGRLGLVEIKKNLLAAALTSTTCSERILIACLLLPLRSLNATGEQLLRLLLLGLLDDLNLDGACSHAGYNFVDLVHTVLGPEEVAIKLAENNAACASFWLGALSRLLEPRVDHTSIAPPAGLVERLARTVTDALAVSKLFRRGAEILDLRLGRICECSSVSSNRSSSGAIDGLQLASLIPELLARGTHSVVAYLAFKIAGDAALISPRTSHLFGYPFWATHEKRGVPLPTARYRHLFAAILEAYLARCVGSAPSVKWDPKFRKVFCLCRICHLFNCFLKSSATAASFTSTIPADVSYIKRRLVPYGYKSHRCRFTMENGVMIVRKCEEADEQSRQIWEDRMAKANGELAKLKWRLALRTIVGDDYLAIFDFQPDQEFEQSSPVPVESLMMSGKETPRLDAAEAPFSTPPKSPSYVASKPSGGSHASSLERFKMSTINRAASHPAGLNGYTLFAAELQERRYDLRLPTFTTPELAQRWKELSDRSRQYYSVKAANLRPTAAPGASSPTIPNRYGGRLPSIPQSLPRRAPLQSQSTPFQRSANVVGGQLASSSASRRWPSTPSSRPTAAATVLPPSGSRTVLAPISSSRLNSAQPPRSHPKIKKEITSQATPSRGVRQTAPVVIDLTGDD